MNKKSLVLLMSIGICLSACNSKKQKNDESPVLSKTFYEIDFSRDFTGSSCNNLLLSDMFEDVEYIQLETTNECLIDQRTFYALTNKDIYILNKSYTKEKLFRFDRSSGNFISTIGKTGQGPQDMQTPSALYAENSFIYASSNAVNKVFVYRKDGEYVRTVHMQRGTGERITILKDKYIISHPGQNYKEGENNFKEGNPNQYNAAVILDMEGNILFTQRDTLKGEGLPYMTLDWDPKRWYFNNQLNYYNEVDNIIYEVNEKGIIPRYKFNLGKNRWTVTGKMTKETMAHIKFHCFKETSDYLFIYWNQNQKAYFARFDKHTEKLDVMEDESAKGRFWHLKANGPQNDIDGCGIYFTTSENYEDKTGNFIFTITPDNIDYVRASLEKAKNVKFPEKRQQLLKMLGDREEDDNPILVIYKLKR